MSYNNFTYTAVQAEKFSSFPELSVSIVGDSLMLRSEPFDFWVVWDANMNAVVGVTSNLLRRVDGLCGFYSKTAADDKLTPTGLFAPSTQEFGDSWSLDTERRGADSCNAPQCPVETQKLAWEKCSQTLRSPPFDQCHIDSASSVESAVSRCVQFMCDCMAGQQQQQQQQESADALVRECTCQSLGIAATECRNRKPGADLSGWRSRHDCTVDCSANPGSVFKECNKRTCELTCNNKKNPNACPESPDLCVPGCVCPDGLVRKDDRCVKPNECRDCVCDGFGDPQYFSFDRSNFTFNGNCTYVAARDKLLPTDDSQNGHDFQVYLQISRHGIRQLF